MGIETVSLIISVFVAGSLGIAALMRNFRSRLCLSFGIFCAVSFLRDVLSVLDRFDVDGGFASPRLHLFLTLLAGPLLLSCLSEMVPSYRKPLRKIIWGYVPVLLLAAMWLRSPLYPHLALLGNLLGHLAFVIPTAIWILTVDRAQKHARLTRERLRLRFAFWGALFAVALHATDVMNFYGVPVPALGTIARILYLMFIFQTFIQKELITAEEVVAKISLFGGVAFMLTSIFLLLVAWVGDRRDLFVFNTLIASFVIIVLFEPIRNLSMKMTRKLFLRKNTLLEQQLNSLSEEVMGSVEPSELARRLESALRRSLDIESASLYLLDRDGLTFLRVRPSAKGNAAVFSPEISSSIPLVEYMTLRRGRPFVLETIENDRDSFRQPQPRKFCQACIDSMRTLQTDFIIPFFDEGKIIAFYAVRAGERIVLSNEQLRLFIPVSRQIAMLLKNARTFSLLRDRDKLAAVGEMAAGLAHEIKNPLGAIKGAAQLLKSTSDKREPAGNEFLSIILDETDRLSGVLTDFLDYAKPRKNYPQSSCDPLRVIEHTAALCLRDRKVAFEVVSESEGIKLEVDPELLKQVLLNLFLNALQAMDEAQAEPKLTVRLKEIRPRKPFAFAGPIPLYKIWEGWENFHETPTSPFVEIEVLDNGPGIREEELPRIFTPFFTTKAKGTGLGLAICQRLVEGMGGTIHVRRNIPTGSIFTIHLPIARIETKELRENRSETERTEKEI